MKNKIITYLNCMLIISLFSCTDSTTENVVTNEVDSDTLFNNVPQTIFTGIYDTIGYTFLVNTITEEQFNSLPSRMMKEDSLRKIVCGSMEGGCMEAMEKEYISKVPSKVQRKEQTLNLILQNGTVKIFKNNTKEDEDYEVYQFLRLDENGYYIVAAYYFESYAYLLINSYNGKTIKTVGRLAFSPDRTKYVAWNYDMAAAFTFNGIDFLNVAKDSVVSNVLMDFKTWGPEEVKWKDDSTLYVKQKSQMGEELKEVNNFAAIRIRLKSRI